MYKITYNIVLLFAITFYNLYHHIKLKFGTADNIQSIVTITRKTRQLDFFIIRQELNLDKFS